MTSAYFDASALVKLLLDEEGRDHVTRLWLGADAVVTSRIGSVEVRAALAAAARNGRLDDAGHALAEAGWATLRSGIRYVELDRRIELDAGDLTGRHALSGADAVHLASALRFGSDDVVVATWDRRLHAAARREGLAVLPSELPS